MTKWRSCYKYTFLITYAKESAMNRRLKSLPHLITMDRRWLMRNVRDDRLSRLPDHLLHEIYSSLETIYIVQASVLSKRWKNLWKSTPNLYFHHRWDNVRFMDNFVNHVFRRRYCSNIFAFRFSGFMEAEREAMYISYAIAHNAQVFDICTSTLDIQFPQCFFNSKSVQGLKLRFVKLPLSLESESLKCLHLNECFISDKVFDGDLFSNCPNLETLVLAKLTTQVRELIIRAAKLRYLEVSIDHQTCDSILLHVAAPRLTTFKYETHHYSTLLMEYIPLIEQVHVSFCKSVLSICPNGTSRNDVALHLVKILKELSSAKSVTLSFSTLEALRMEPITWLIRLPSPFHKIKHLNVKCDDLYYRRNRSITLPSEVLFYLLKDSPSAITTMTGLPQGFLRVSMLWNLSLTSVLGCLLRLLFRFVKYSIW